MLKKITALFVLILLILNTVNAQNPCATLQIQGPPGNAVPCDDTLILTANITFPVVNNTDTYTGSVIPFTPEPWVGPNTIIANTDDVWSGVIALPFPFCFFGQVYNSMVVGSNGLVCFDLSVAGGFNAWSSWNGGPPNNWVCPINNNTLNNTIMTPFHDIDPGIAGVISWGINGIAPCRKMVVNFTSVPMFSCTGLIDTQQVVLYEMTNNIDINIKNKPICATWNGGIAHEGIQNANGTVAIMTPGRNGTIWTANDDAYRFSPSGPPTPITYSYTWIDLNTNQVLGTDDSLVLPPPVTTTDIICQVNVTGGCLPYSFADTLHLSTGSIVADFDYEFRLGCEKDTVIFTNLTAPTAGTTYYWTFGDPSAPNFTTNPTHVYPYQGSFNVTLIANHPICPPDTIGKNINTSHPIKAVITVQAYPPGFIEDSICLGDKFVASGVNSLPGVVGQAGLGYEWNWGDGTPLEYGVITNPQGHIYAEPGTYTLSLIITDSLGCKDTATQLLYVDPPGFQDFTISDTLVCVGEPINFVDSIAPHANSFSWDFGDGKVLPNQHNPNHSYDKAGVYSVSLTSNYVKCPPSTTTYNLEVEDYPDVSLGKDTAICPGLTGAIILNNLVNSAQTLTWSTGEVSNSITITNPGYYWAKAGSPKGACITTDSIWIQRDCYINIPNSFSPNDDGLNDYFFPRELLSSGVTAFRMNIYNRWGENIFTTDKIDGRGWDGKYDGKLQNMGVYVYVLDVVFKNTIRKSFKGNVTLLK